ncbi:MAG: biotin-dependent carboxyltransferase family protein [Litorivicinus sp.]
MASRVMAGHLIVVRSSPLHSLQDHGRFGFARFGIAQAGAADRYSLAWANYLLGNASGTAAIELTGGGFEAEFSCHQSFALTGAFADVQLDGAALLPWRSYQARAGSRLRIGSPRSGNHIYLAVAGGFAIASTLGSVSCSRRDGLGGTDGDGRGLAAGELLPLTGAVSEAMAVPRSRIPDYRAPLELPLRLGYQAADFSPRDRARLLAEPYQLSAQFNRMGVRLRHGPALEPPGMEFSEPIALGAVQVPPDGQPIVLLNDRQTLGGYPKIGCVLEPALCALSQRRQGAWVQFVGAV